MGMRARLVLQDAQERVRLKERRLHLARHAGGAEVGLVRRLAQQKRVALVQGVAVHRLVGPPAPRARNDRSLRQFEWEANEA